MSSELDSAISELVSANRILGNEGILDSLGHVSIRDPEDPKVFLLSRARSPEMIQPSDILKFHLDGTPLASQAPPLYIERFIHGAIYEARPEINAVCHNHALSILPFGISKSLKLQAVIQTAHFLGKETPVWDIAEDFGTGTDLLVRSIDQGRSLSRRLGSERVALMRGHGSVLASDDIVTLVTMSIGMDRNAKVLIQAAQFGEFQPLHDGELAAWKQPRNVGRGDNRAWEYFLHRAGL